MMTATITKTRSAQPIGTYVPTTLDAEKAAADILIQAVEGDGTFSLFSRVPLSGRGIRQHTAGNYSATERAMERLQATYNVRAYF